jgi:heme exporter protein A
MNAAPLAVEAAGLCRRYGRRWALVDVSLHVPSGNVVMITGRNGSGKSTLLRVLSTAIRADRGTARVAGYDIRTATQQVRHRVALLSHHSHLYEALSALENLSVVARFLRRDVRREALLPLLDEVGLADRADDTVSTYSAGMRKRLSLARTLLQQASVIFLDEPYGQLDPPGFRLVDGLLDRFRRAGVTVLMATHLLERGSALCDLGVVLEEGRLRWSGPAGELPTRGGLDPAALPEVD